MARGPQQGTSIQLGRLKVGEFVGEGGFGVVHKATLDGITVPFAIKFLHPSAANDDLETAAKRFFREADVLFRLRHAHIVPIYGVGEHGGRPYILMEYFDGMNLVKAREAVGQPPPESVLAFIERIGGALAYAHEKGVVHRDIKPQNLMTIKGDARVLDFGVAALTDPNGERFTRSSEAVAGDAFSAPELTENPKLLDPRCDIYSLGACWYWLLTGMSPKGVNWESRLRASAKISPEYERVVLRCLEQADRRYVSADDLIADVRSLRMGTQPSQSPHDLTDDQARILGVVVASCATTLETVTYYRIEQEIGKRQARIRTSLALRNLLGRKLIAEEQDSDDFGNTFAVYKPLDEGATWAERNLSRVEELLAPRSPTAPPFGTDEIPF